MITKEIFMEIWNLRRQGLSQRTIAKKLGISRNTVSKYLKLGEIPKPKPRSRHSKLEPFYQIIEALLDRDNYQATRIYEILAEQGFDGSYSTVKEYVRKVKKQRKKKAYIRFETLPGYQAQVDFADFKVVNPDGSETTYYCFSMVLGFSRHIYQELVPDCKMPNFLDCHIRAFEFFGGVPAELVYDNLKNVVLKHIVGRETKYNETFLDFACHYRFKPHACNPYAGWEKGKVESMFKYTRERFWRGYEFKTLEQANRDLQKWLMDVAFQRKHGTHQQLVKERFELEKPHLGELPRRAYDTSEKVSRKVYKDCLISFQGIRYGVPHDYVGQRVLVKFKADQLSIYHHDQCLVTYQRPQEKGAIIVKPWIYEALKADKSQLKKKYGAVSKKGKAKRVESALPSAIFTEVNVRDLSIYESLIGGGACLS